MSIKYAILGFLSWKPMTGYDLKKMFTELTFIHWSANNNQIYRSLMELHKEGFVNKEVQHQENYPSRKIYTITEKGSLELKNWVMSNPELPQFKNTFLIKLAWSDQLTTKELDEILNKYEQDVNMQLLMQREQKRRNEISPTRNRREGFVWDMIRDNEIFFYENELRWVQKFRKELCEKW